MPLPQTDKPDTAPLYLSDHRIKIDPFITFVEASTRVIVGAYTVGVGKVLTDVFLDASQNHSLKQVLFPAFIATSLYLVERRHHNHTVEIEGEMAKRALEARKAEGPTPFPVFYDRKSKTGISSDDLNGKTLKQTIMIQANRRRTPKRLIAFFVGAAAIGGLIFEANREKAERPSPQVIGTGTVTAPAMPL